MRHHFTPSHDTQLWRVSDCKDGRNYTWPLLATPGTTGNGECYYVQPGVAFRSIEQREFVHQRLSSAAFETENSRWLIAKSSFQKLASRCEGITPDYYVRWDTELEAGSAETPPESDESEDSGVDSEFINYLVASGPEFGNKRSALLCYLRFCNVMRQWLLERHQTVDLRFVKLHAFPYRTNWQPILHQAHKDRLADLSKAESPEQRREVAAAIGLRDSLYCVDLIGMEGGTFTWSILAEPTSHWTDVTRKTEAQSLGFGANLYLQRWSKLISKLYDSILSSLATWVSASALPLGAVDTSLPENLWGLGRRRSRGRVRSVAPPPPDAYYSTEPFEKSPQIVPSGALQEAEQTVQEVPDALFRLQLVRPHRRVDRKRVDAPGVLVPAGPGNPVPDQKMLGG